MRIITQQRRNAYPPLLAEKLDLHERLYFLYYSLEYEERTMLAQRLGFCPKCMSTHYRDRCDRDEYGDPKLKVIKPLPYTDIATLYGQSDPDTAKRTCEGALGKMYRELMNSGNRSGKKDDGKKGSKDGITNPVKDS